MDDGRRWVDVVNELVSLRRFLLINLSPTNSFDGKTLGVVQAIPVICSWENIVSPGQDWIRGILVHDICSENFYSALY